MTQAQDIPHTPNCGELCWCPDDVFWGRLLGDDDPAAPGKDWAAAAFGPQREDLPRHPNGTPRYEALPEHLEYAHRADELEVWEE